MIHANSICQEFLAYKTAARIDIQIEITPVPFKDISKAQPGEPSAAIRERVVRARQIQEERFRDHKGIHSNAQMAKRFIHQYAEFYEAGIQMLHMAIERFSLSARAPHPKGRTHHCRLGEGSVYAYRWSHWLRQFDRGDWAERGVLIYLFNKNVSAVQNENKEIYHIKYI